MRLATETPSWFDPADTVWLGESDLAKKRLLRDKVAHGAAHLIREVRIYAPNYAPPYSIPDIRDMLHKADREYAYLRKAGLVVPDVDFYAHNARELPGPALIARVPVIEGLTLPASESPDPRVEELRLRCAELIAEYYHQSHGRDAIFEHMGPYQCIYGHERRHGGQAADSFTVADIEPEMF